MNEDLLIQLFDKFSSPVTRAAVSESQKEEATIITQVLWLYLINQMDSENFNKLEEWGISQEKLDFFR